MVPVKTVYPVGGEKRRVDRKSDATRPTAWIKVFLAFRSTVDKKGNPQTRCLQHFAAAPLTDPCSTCRHARSRNTPSLPARLAAMLANHAAAVVAAEHDSNVERGVALAVHARRVRAE